MISKFSQTIETISTKSFFIRAAAAYGRGNRGWHCRIGPQSRGKANRSNVLIEDVYRHLLPHRYTQSLTAMGGRLGDKLSGQSSHASQLMLFWGPSAESCTLRCERAIWRSFEIGQPRRGAEPAMQPHPIAACLRFNPSTQGHGGCTTPR
jgi:hypothetical protein